MTPFLCLAAAWLVTTSWQAVIPATTGSRRSMWSRCAVAVAAVGVVLPSAWSVWRFNDIISQTDNRVLIANWLREHVRPGESLLQSGSVYGHAQVDEQGFVRWVWDRQRRVFLVDGQRATGRPDWILLQDSPLPSTTQEIVKEFLHQDYEVAWQFTAFSPKEKRVYDLQDAFFTPYAGFGGVTRPGPNFTVYRRSRPKSTDQPRLSPR